MIFLNPIHELLKKQDLIYLLIKTHSTSFPLTLEEIEKKSEYSVPLFKFFYYSVNLLHL